MGNGIMILLIVAIIITAIQYIAVAIEIFSFYNDPGYSFIGSSRELLLWFIPLLMPIVSFIRKIKIMMDNLNAPKI